jgi:menaquinone-dependent protoporphyrinogen oxidase
MFHWHKDAHRFLVRHQKALLERHLAIFALGPVRDPHDEQEWQASRDQLGKELAIYPWLKPLDLEMFGGKYDPTKLGFPLKLFAGKAPATDIRDWNAVRAWAKEMAAQLDEEHVEFPLR